MALRRWWLALPALAGLAAGGFALVSHGAADRAPVAVAPPPGPVGVGALGRIEPASRIRKLNQPGGMSVTRLERLLVAEGERVAAGQLLAVFADAAQKDAAVAQAEQLLAGRGWLPDCLRVQPHADAPATGGEEVDANDPARTEAPACA